MQSVLLGPCTALSALNFTLLLTTTIRTLFQDQHQHHMPQGSFSSWLESVVQRSQMNDLPSRSQWLESLVQDSAHSSDPDLLDDCAICYRAFTGTSERSRICLPCGHRHFCRGCLQEWAMENKTTCPYCRKELWYLPTLSNVLRAPRISGISLRRNAIVGMPSLQHDFQDLPEGQSTPHQASRNFIIASQTPHQNIEDLLDRQASTPFQRRVVELFRQYHSSTPEPRTGTRPLSQAPVSARAERTAQQDPYALVSQVQLFGADDRLTSVAAAATQTVEEAPTRSAFTVEFPSWNPNDFI